jgi:hypothetical protein
MRRNNITATAMHLTSSKMRDFASKINAGNMGILGKINLPSYIHVMQYIEDVTEEVRNVTCIDFGCPVQLSVCFYR